MRRDIEDIRELKKNDPFNRYWMRRLKQKIEITQQKFEEDPPVKVDKDEREVLRRLLLAYKELADMMDVDEGNIKADLQRQG